MLPEEIINSTPLPKYYYHNSGKDGVKDIAFKSCFKAASDRKNSLLNGVNQIDDFYHWQALSVDTQMLLMATYVPEHNAPDVAVHLLDDWSAQAPRKSKNEIDENGWAIVRGRRDIDESDEVGSDSGGGDGENYCHYDPNIAREILDRDVLSSDYFNDLQLYKGRQKPRSDLDIVRDICSRPPYFEVQDSLFEKLDKLVEGDTRICKRPQRAEILKAWAYLLKLDSSTDLAKHTIDFNSAASVNHECDAAGDAELLRGAAVIGMTTTGAAKYNRYLTFHSTATFPLFSFRTFCCL